MESVSVHAAVRGETFDLQRLEIEQFGRTVDVDPHDVPCLVEIHDHSLAYFTGVHARPRAQVDVQRVGLWIVMEFHAHTSGFEASVGERVVDRLAVCERNHA
jgi:hypothetical protein